MNKCITFALIAVLAVLAPAAPAESLFRGDRYQALIHDHRARAVGDSLTVVIYESAAATSRSDVKAGRSSDIEVSATDRHNTVGVGLNSDNDFDGSGVERRSGEVIARVTVAITDVLPNGDLLIAGEQRISLNNEDQFIRVGGRVRPADIDATNTVLSSRIADADIEFKGQGLLSARSQPGLLTRFFHWLF